MATTTHPPMHLQAQAGASLAIVLDAAPAAGLLWQAPDAPAGCSLVAGAHVPGGAGTGAGVQQVFAFTAADAGRHTLRFALQRSWEAEPHAVQVVTVQVD